MSGRESDQRQYSKTLGDGAVEGRTKKMNCLQRSKVGGPVK